MRHLNIGNSTNNICIIADYQLYYNLNISIYLSILSVASDEIFSIVFLVYINLNHTFRL